VFNPNTPVDTRIAVLEEKFSVYEQMMTKVESAIHTISETCQGISKMLAIHDERIESNYKSDSIILEKIKDLELKNDRDHNRVINKITDLENKFEERNAILRAEFEIKCKDQDAKIKDQDNKVDGLIKFRWLIVGGMLLVAFIFSQQQFRLADFLPNTHRTDIVRPGK
jgi:uncharacterized coiled-coil protein SlyX